MPSQKQTHTSAGASDRQGGTQEFFLKIFILRWTIFKVFIEFITMLLLFYVLVYWPQDQGSSPHPPWTGRESLNPWPSREVPGMQEIDFKSVSGESSVFL